MLTTPCAYQGNHPISSWYEISSCILTEQGGQKHPMGAAAPSARTLGERGSLRTAKSYVDLRWYKPSCCLRIVSRWPRLHCCVHQSPSHATIQNAPPKSNVLMLEHLLEGTYLLELRLFIPTAKVWLT
jgi:hypothetical protein